MPKKNPEIIRKRNIAVHKLFTQLYQVQRMRPDDCIRVVAEKFFITESYVLKILRVQDEEPQEEEVVVKNKNQQRLF